MDGYSVTEAASVLGVPTERVWELLARGVLSGAPEGDTGMRVYLQPRPQPSAPSDDPRRPNGDRGGEPEASPFRELLTEFRSLTERYGQALLALGEARGEVASLRSRVDVLEARMDLRLPMGTGPSTPWPAPVTRPTPPVETGEAAAEHAEEEEHRARRRGPRRATESFAEALARAEDPSIPELPVAAAADETLEAPHGEVAEGPSEPALPRELPPADTVPVADELEPAEEPMIEFEAEAIEPEDAADEPVALDVQPEPVFVESEPEGIGPAKPEPAGEAEPEPMRDPEADAGPGEGEAERAAGEPDGGGHPPDESADLEPLAHATTEPVEAAESEPPAAEAATEPVEAAEDEPVADGSEPAPVEFDADRYTTAIEDPDWFEAEADDEPARAAYEIQPELEPEPESVEAAEPEPEPESVEAAEPEPEPESVEAAEPEPEPVEAAEPEPEPEPESVEAAETEPGAEPQPAFEPPASTPEVTSVPATSDEPTLAIESATADEETMLWFGQRPVDASGADEMEVAGGGSAQPPAAVSESAPSPLPGSAELDEALVALEELTRRTEVPEAILPDERPPAPVGRAEPTAGGSVSQPRATPAPRPSFVAGRPGSPATRAYRRLRRIFPG